VSQIAAAFAEAFRDYAVSGIPASGRNFPSKVELRNLGLIIEKGVGFSVPATADIEELRATMALAQQFNVDLLLSNGLQLDDQLVIEFPLRMRGKGSFTQVEFSNPEDSIVIRSSDVTIANLYFHDVAKESGWSMTLDTGVGHIERIAIWNVTTWGSKGGLRDIGTGKHTSVFVTNLHCRYHQGPGVDIRRGYAYQRYTDLTVDFNESPDLNHQAMYFAMTQFLSDPAAGGGIFSGLHVLGGGLGAIKLVDYRAGWFFGDNAADTNDGTGWEMIRCNKMEGAITAQGTGLSGLILEDCQNCDLLYKANGRKGLPSAIPGAYGVWIRKGAAGSGFAGAGNAWVTVRLQQISDFTSHGVFYDLSQAGGGNVTIDGGQIYGCGGWGIFSSGATWFLGRGQTIASCDLGAASCAGAFNYLTDLSTLNNTAPTNYGPGPFTVT